MESTEITNSPLSESLVRHSYSVEEDKITRTDDEDSRISTVYEERDEVEVGKRHGVHQSREELGLQLEPDDLDEEQRARRIEILKQLRMRREICRLERRNLEVIEDDSVSESSSQIGPNGAPPKNLIRRWHDITGQFKVDAALLAYKDGNLRLQKTNGVIIQVPAKKMSVEDMTYVKRSMDSEAIVEDDCISQSSSQVDPNGQPPKNRVRTWHDITGQFEFDAALLVYKDGNLWLHKTNGIIIQIPAEKLSVEDRKYVVRLIVKMRRSNRLFQLQKLKTLKGDHRPISTVSSHMDSFSGTPPLASSHVVPGGTPPKNHIQTWCDRTGQFKVNAALLAYKDGKLRMHKTNSVIIEVPTEKMSVEDMKYVQNLMDGKKLVKAKI
ncbi:hypothetical protein D9758_016651 [Tetrapyrgos nigripes]|uniref:SLA1 homology domain-containing protein n=1 Tax=Tetrapyrgos nigripes TaxID=182062 RepID=A0A8H5FLR8_9AGAR|nr:hypothetical protein D9758_016651 [Tetrapyrgos nigripes]